MGTACRPLFAPAIIVRDNGAGSVGVVEADSNDWQQSCSAALGVGRALPLPSRAVEIRYIILYYFVMQTTAKDKKTISFRIEEGKLAALDRLAKAQTRDRTFLLSQAVDAYLEVQQWQLEHIREGLRQADAGMGADHESVKAKWQRRLRARS